MADKDDKVWIWTGYGEGYYVSKEEYEANYRDTYGTLTEDEATKQRQIEQNAEERDMQTVQQVLADKRTRKGRHINNSGILKTIDKNIAEIDKKLKQIRDEKKAWGRKQETPEETYLITRRKIWSKLKTEAETK